MDWFAFAREEDYRDPADYAEDLCWANSILERKEMELTPEEMALVEAHRSALAERERLQALWHERFSELMAIHDSVEDDSTGWNAAAHKFIAYSEAANWDGDELDEFIEGLLRETGYHCYNIKHHGWVWKKEG